MSTKVHTLKSISSYLHLSEKEVNQVLNEFSKEDLNTSSELIALIEKIGIATDKIEETQELVFDIDERVNIITHKLKFIEEATKPKTALLSEVIPPSIISTQYYQSLIEMAGGRVFTQDELEKSESNPDVIILLSEEMERMFGGLANMLTLEEWKETNAVKKNQVFLIDGLNHLKGWDVNFASDLEILAEILYPQYLTFSGKGEAWISFEL